MKKLNSKRGIIPVAIAFVLIITIIIGVIITYFWGKSALAVNRLKRFQAINYTEAALYETFNRFRVNHDVYSEWDAAAWVGGTAPTSTQDTWNNVLVDGTGQPIVRIITPEGDQVDVEINVVQDGSRYKVSATVDYDDIKL